MSSAWTLEFTPRARKQLRKLNPQVSERIVRTLRRDMDAGINPRDTWDPLVGQLTGLWKYRIGDYRAIACVEDDRIVVVVIDVDHRSKVYR
ncbi:MAG: hypothetical protein AVDCRST_MAG91-800 [uncultured Sphingomonadaceae bacterium]|uniref:Type II toxin-antitoxin system RelE/ParE family toxin n=1 Tax=uncultured Sphingomonadaceae bacterium TaxID=169976 RepID=A0A6J4SDB5_9SPHN|nr:MAG: hypothetical protein AVDCRST_MAG91-800 [uncultured Sphingomonadaceae bacterium]